MNLIKMAFRTIQDQLVGIQNIYRLLIRLDKGILDFPISFERSSEMPELDPTVTWEPAPTPATPPQSSLNIWRNSNGSRNDDLWANIAIALKSVLLEKPGATLVNIVTR